MTEILTSIHGRKFGLGSNNEVLVADAITGVMRQIGEPRAQVIRAFKQITSAQLLTLNTTPVQVIAAPGAGLAIVPVRMTLYKPAGVAYAGIATGEDLVLKYTNGSGAQCSGVVETTGFLDQTTAQTRWVGQPGSTGATASDVTPVANAAVVLGLLVGDITTGDQALNVEIIYSLISTVFTS